MTGTDLCVNKCKLSRSYLNHLLLRCTDPWSLNLQQTSDTQQAVSSKLQTLGTDFVYAGSETLVLWCDKCLNVSGDYAEVWRVPRVTDSCATYTHSEVRIEFSASESFVAYFLELLCTFKWRVTNGHIITLLRILTLCYDQVPLELFKFAPCEVWRLHY